MFFFATVAVFAQTKVKGVVVNTSGEPIPFCNVIFEGSLEGTTTDDNGIFSLASEKTWQMIDVSFIGYETQIIKLPGTNRLNLKVILKEASESLDEVVIITGKQPKKNNPAIAILEEIWKRKRKNGLQKFKTYQYDKYEKVRIDLNAIGEKFKNSFLFKDIKFVFDNIDTTQNGDKNFLPLFLNENLFQVYGNNESHQKNEILVANQNSGFKGNKQLISFVEDFYTDYNIYENHIKLYDKSFSSPLSKTGVSNYNYVLADSAFIGNKWCYNIVYYPRRKNELTFKGDFWVSDSTFAVKEINLRISKNANINWVRDIYIEQEFDILNDSVFVLKRDYSLTDFALNEKNDKGKGAYAKKTTIYSNHVFNQAIAKRVFLDKSYLANEAIFNKDKRFWEENRLEKLNDSEQKIYQLYDTLQKTKKFRRFKNIASAIGTKYYSIDKLNIEIGNLFTTIGSNDVEGVRLQSGFRTFKTYNDLFRFQAYGAYGFLDKNFKYGFQAKWLVEPKSRLILFAGNRKDVEQNGASLTGSINVLGRSEGSSAVLSTGVNDKFTSVNLTSVGLSVEPVPSFSVRLVNDFKTLSSASETFSLAYNDPEAPTGISSEIKQFETALSIGYYPKRIKTGYGVERDDGNTGYTRYFTKITKGSSGIFNSDFDYTKIQFSFTKLFKIGSLGRLKSSLEAGQTFGEVPLALLSIAPGNQSLFKINNSFNLLNFYEFVTDRYSAVHLEHNFNGRILSRIPLLKKTKLRTIVGFKTFTGSITDENIALNTTGSPIETPLIAPNKKPYYEYSVGIANIFKVLEIDFNFRGNYLDNVPNVRKFGITGTIDFKF